MPKIATIRTNSGFIRESWVKQIWEDCQMRTANILTTILVSCGFCLSANAQQADMTFFITSVGPGKGGDLGGLAGADAHCQSLAQAAGAGNKTWRAYLSTNARGGANPVHACEQLRLRPGERLERRGREPDDRGEAGAEAESRADASHFAAPFSHFSNASAELASRLVSLPFS